MEVAAVAAAVPVPVVAAAQQADRAVAADVAVAAVVAAAGQVPAVAVARPVDRVVADAATGREADAAADAAAVRARVATVTADGETVAASSSRT